LFLILKLKMKIGTFNNYIILYVYTYIHIYIYIYNRIMIEQLIMDYLIPEQLNNTVRVDRIINIVSSLDERGFLGFVSLLNRQKT